MSTNIVIVESPAKSKTISKYLNSNPNLKNYGKFIVLASYGHIRDLSKKNLGIDIEHNFRPNYELIPDKKKLVDDLKKQVKDAKTVWLASDYDREGEAISMHIKEALKLKDYKRITFTEITSKALETAIKNPRKIDDNLVDAQETRRMLDRLVGFSLSPILWKKFNASGTNGLSAGRVQSAVLDIIINKELEINKFKTSAYWTILSYFVLKVAGARDELEDVKLYCGDNLCKYDDINSVKKLFQGIRNEFSISDVKTKTTNQYPDLPFITSSLQQEAYSKVGLSIKRTMQVAQELYENGLITYMRTDSHNISEDFQADTVKYIVNTYGQSYWESNGPKKTKVVKNAQEAHECIRPVNITKLNVKDENSKFTKDHEKLYELIWRRTIAYFMKACVYDELEVSIKDSSFAKDMAFITTYKKVKFNGFMIVYNIKNDTYDFSKYITNLKTNNYQLECKSLASRNTWTSPPARFNESSMVKTLEAEGLGRPSTYSAILQKLIDKQYVIKSDVKGIEKETLNITFDPKNKSMKEEKSTTQVGSEKTRLVPTDIGREIDKFLAESFDYILDKQFTANMEADLDKIANGDKKMLDILSTFWKPFKKDLDKYSDLGKTDKIKLKTESNEFTIKGIKYTVRIAKYGPVIQYESNGKTEYIPLKNYLKYVNKEYTDVDEKDIKMLVKLPLTVAEVSGKPIELHLGAYGLYFKYNNKNVKITVRMIKNFLETGEFDPKDIKASLEYAKKQATQNTDTKEKEKQTKSIK